MKIGLIARAEYARGLAIQSRNFYDHMPVDRVLLVVMPRPDCDQSMTYGGCQQIIYDDMNHTLDERVVREWMDGLDVVFTVETPYDWRLPDWARSMGVKTVIQGNPEFYRHGQEGFERLAHPDAWWWPTPWRWNQVPHSRPWDRVMPVPMPHRQVSARRTGRPRFLHVVGKRAYADRNGTDIVMDCLRAIQTQVDFTISGFGWELPEIVAPSNVNLTVEREGVTDRWTMYEDHSVLILPRRYGGLCLPALEAAACGLGVSMPDCSPNEVLASDLIPCRIDRPLRLATGRLLVADVTHVDLARRIDEIADSQSRITEMQLLSLKNVPRWADMKQVYVEALERIVDEVEG